VRHPTGFYPQKPTRDKPESADRIIKSRLAVSGGLENWVFWRKWGVWLKDGAALRR
jgi:hypothetical protein